MIEQLKTELLITHSKALNSSCINLSFKEYFQRLRGHLISSKKYSNVELLNKNDANKSIVVAERGIVKEEKPLIIFKPLSAKIYFYIQFEEKENKLFPIQYNMTFYKDDETQFRFDKIEELNDYTHPNCHVHIGGKKEPRFPTPCLDIFYILFFIEGFKV